MAVPASSLFASNPKIQIKLFMNQPCRVHRWPVFHAHSQLSPMCFTKLITKAQLGEPNRFSLQLGIAKERLWEATPHSVKEFPWREAADMLLQRLLVIGKKALKWSLLTLYILSSTSDVIFSIYRHRELMIPIGLLVGCLIADFLKETLQEFFRGSEDKGSNLPFVSISCFFVLVKVLAAYYTAWPQVFLLHVANGGLLQALWLWRYLLKEKDDHNAENLFDGQDV